MRYRIVFIIICLILSNFSSAAMLCCLVMPGGSDGNVDAADVQLVVSGMAICHGRQFDQQQIPAYGESTADTHHAQSDLVGDASSSGELSASCACDACFQVSLPSVHCFPPSVGQYDYATPVKFIFTSKEIEPLFYPPKHA